MSIQDPVAIVSAGVVCSVGLSAPAACAAFRACLDNFKETLFVDHVGQQIIGAAISPGTLGLNNDDGWITGGEDKLARMLVLAVAECAGTTSNIDIGRAALLIVGPEKHRSAISSAGLQRCLVACEDKLGKKLHQRSRVIQVGSPGLVEALHDARELLASREVQSVLVAGVDSFLNPGDINEALGDGRLLTRGSSDGFIPGEAAACVLVTNRVIRNASRAPSLLVTGLGAAHEAQTQQANLRSRGVGLAQAIQQALWEGDIAAHAVHARYADVTAESYFFEEASYGWTRVLRAPSPVGYKFFTPVTRVGHIGAAMGPLILAVVLDNVCKGWAVGPNTLVHLSCSHTPRAALLVVAS